MEIDPLGRASPRPPRAARVEPDDEVEFRSCLTNSSSFRVVDIARLQRRGADRHWRIGGDEARICAPVEVPQDQPVGLGRDEALQAPGRDAMQQLRVRPTPRHEGLDHLYQHDEGARQRKGSRVWRELLLESVSQAFLTLSGRACCGPGTGPARGWDPADRAPWPELGFLLHCASSPSRDGTASGRARRCGARCPRCAARRGRPSQSSASSTAASQRARWCLSFWPWYSRKRKASGGSGRLALSSGSRAGTMRWPVPSMM